jgi:VWFA-related protein
VLLLFIAVPLLAQREEITVEVVNVPVYIYLSTKPVEGLTRDDFELLVNGKPQPIDYFDVMDLGEPVARPGTPAAFAEQRRLFLLLFDMTFSSPERILRGQRAAATIVQHAAPGDAFAVVTYSPAQGMDVLLQFTSEREAILGTVATLRPHTAEIADRQSVLDGHGPAVVAFFEPPAVAGGEGTRGGSGEIAQPTPLSHELARQPIERQAEAGIEGLSDLATALRRIEGFNKHVILFSEGFRGGSTGRILPLIDQMQQAFQGANTFLHALDTAGLRHTFQIAAGDSLRQLSEATGGEWIHNSNDLSGALTALSESYRRAYILGFRSTSARAGHNSITVRVKHLPHGARVTYRRGFLRTAS